VVGLHTNTAFLRRVVNSRAFSSADLDTALIERERAALFDAPPLPLAVSAAGIVAHALADERAQQDADPWSRRDGWRLHGVARRVFTLEHAQGGTDRVVLERTHDGGMVLVVGDERLVERLNFAARALGADRHEVQLGTRRLTLSAHAVGEQVTVFAPEGSAQLREVDVLAHAGDTAAEGGRITAPMPGKVVAFLAQPGDSVKRGQALAVMEAMKMEHTLSAPADGVVKALRFAPGEQVAEGEALLDFEAAAK
jgi:3-methylcrotonyl-CoA carboxylase alpha subunit